MEDLEVLLAYLRKLPSQAALPLELRRSLYDRAEKAYPTPADVGVEPWSMNGLRGEILRPARTTGCCLLYLHGGGFVIGSVRSHRHLVAALARDAACEALCLDYPLAPEHPFPAALESAVDAYSKLLACYGPQRLAIAGDSAGGGLAISTLVASRERGMPMPAAGVCLSPWVDLDVAHRPERCEGDPLVGRDDIARDAAAYLGTARREEPLASPILADLHGLPPLLIEAGASEYLADDSIRLAGRVKEAGGDVRFELTPHVPHVWHWFWPRLALGQAGVARAARFIRERFEHGRQV